MRAERRDNGLPFTRRQSGDKYHRRIHDGDEARKDASRGNKPFGVQLQERIHDVLTRGNVDHDYFANGHPYARSERVELRVRGRDDKEVEFQVTLIDADKKPGKVTDLFRAAIQRTDQTVPRVYLVIRMRERMRVNELADRVFHAIRDVMATIATYVPEPGNVIGLVLRIVNRRALPLLTLNLFAAISANARGYLNGLLAGIEAAKQAARDALAKVELEAKRKLARLALSAVTRSSTTFHMVVAVRDSLHGFRAHPVPSFATASDGKPAFATSQVSHPLRMPFRR